jgi:glycosyltransferase involved in cell wall biosynthesis
MMRPLKVGICHRSVLTGDAIGNDIMGSYALMERMGFQPNIIGEFLDPKVMAISRTDTLLAPHCITSNYDLLIYHHSFYWTGGQEIIDAFGGSLIIKYHNITPAHYFTPYFQTYEKECRAARLQTMALASNPRTAVWLADSSYNRDDLLSAGVSTKNIRVVPPFNRSDRLSKVRHQADYFSLENLKFLFVGRRVPNKGHVHLLKVLFAYVRLFSPSVVLQIVGPPDPHLTRYSEELLALAEDLGISANVHWFERITQHELDSLFRSSHLYINCSEHEGFCVPVIEAQAIGLPVLSVDAGATGETLGKSQILCRLPEKEEDYELMAALIHEIMVDETLRRHLVRQGFKNVYERFSCEVIENQFLESAAPILRKLL